jgi:hypothetical protein
VGLLDRIRRFLLALLVFGMSGVLLELVLLAHYEDGAQLIPLFAIGGALAIVVWHALRPSAASVTLIQIAMVVLLLAGLTGVALHFDGAAEFQREIDPTQGWWAVARKVVRAHAPPLLAPGVLVQLGLVGLIYSYRHPAVASLAARPEESEHAP